MEGATVVPSGVRKTKVATAQELGGNTKNPERKIARKFYIRREICYTGKTLMNDKLKDTANNLESDASRKHRKRGYCREKYAV
jgi:hypothetical protein